MPTTVHLLLAATLTLFFAYQVTALVAVLRSRRALATRRRRPMEILWTLLPVIVVLALATRSWVAILEPGRPVVASASPTPAFPSSGPPQRQGIP